MNFTFKNKQDYQTQRSQLMTKIQTLLDSGKTDEANSEMNNVASMDNAFTNFAEAKANFNALNGSTIIPMVHTNSQGDNTINSNIANGEMYNTAEYRKAFMKNVLVGENIPTQFRNANANTKTSDVGVVIPTTIMQKIVEKMEEHGHILKEVTQTAYKGGLSVPTSSAKPTATWVAEGGTSDTQKKALGTVSFTYHKLRCAISVSLEVETTTLDFFETVFVNQVTEAMIKALETAIIVGTGTGQPKGILKETVITGQNVDIAKTASITYKTLWNVEKVIPSGYRKTAKWCMNYATFCDIMALTDEQGQPIARVNVGLDGTAKYSLLGRSVIFSDDVEPYLDTVEADTVIGFVYNFKDYILNSNLQMTVKQYEDDKTEDKVTKAIMLVDGKCIDINSLVTLTKKSA